MDLLKKILITAVKYFKKIFIRENCCKIILLFLLIPIRSYAQQTIRYDLYVKDTVVNYTGKEVDAIAINGQIPAPKLVFTEGDTAEIYVHNLLDGETSIHWHGIILPNAQDGVPYLTTAPIETHTTHLYKFPIVQTGTYWYHSHTDLQEQSGMYGPLILHKKEEIDSIPEITVLFSDWTNEPTSEVLRSLKTANDWYAIKKHSTQNWGEALVTGHIGDKITQEWKRMLPMDVSDVYYNAFLTNGKREQKYPSFRSGDKVRIRVINGSASTYFWLQFAGSKLTVVASDGIDVEPVEVDRMIIGTAETYDVVVTISDDMSYEFKATAEDRTKSTSLWIGEGMKMPAPVLPKLDLFKGMRMMNDMMNFDGTMDDMGMNMSMQKMDMNSVMYPELNKKKNENKKMDHHEHNMNDDMKEMDKMKMNDTSNMEEMENINMNKTNDSNDTHDMHEMNDTNDMKNMNEMSDSNDMKDMNKKEMKHLSNNEDIITLNYSMLRSLVKTTLPEAPVKVLNFKLTGNMNKYQWSINDRVLSDTDKILIKKGENVRIIMKNESMMRHPMHLHGQSFRVLNGQGEYAPLKNVLDIMPMETDTIEFSAPYEGDWFFHCHILYHMMSGMGRVFRVGNEINGKVKAASNIQVDTIKNSWSTFVNEDNMIHYAASITPQSQGIWANAMVMNNNYNFSFMGSINYHKNYETEFMLSRYLDKNYFLKIYVGGELKYVKEHHNSNTFEKENVATFGFQYTLPLFLIADARVSSEGKFRFQISRKDLALTSRLRFDGSWNTEKEYELGLRYIVLKNLSFTANYDSHFGYGAGLSLIY